MLFVAPEIGVANILLLVYQRYSPLFPPAAVSVTGLPSQADPLVTVGEGTNESKFAETGTRSLSHIPLLMETYIVVVKFNSGMM